MEIRKIFLDTNIVLDLMDSNRKNFKNAVKILEFCIMNDIRIYISEDMLSTIYYVNKDKKYALEFFENVLCNWRIVPFGVDVIKKAISYSKENNYDFEDTLQCFCAKKYKCDVILTNDKDFIDCGVRVFNYNEFLNTFWRAK